MKLIKHRINSIIFWAFIYGLIISCAKSGPPENKYDNCEIKQKVLFQLNFENYAWGCNQRGYFIDNKGIIKRYICPKKEAWRRTSTGYYSKEELDHNYQMADSVIGIITREELCYHYNLIKPASILRLSKLADTACDMGSIALFAYLWDNEKNQYKVVFLSVEGDRTQDNLNLDAITIADWLRLKFNRPRMFDSPPPADNE